MNPGRPIACTPDALVPRMTGLMALILLPFISVVFASADAAEAAQKIFDPAKLPPAASEIDDFVQSDGPKAYEELVAPAEFE